MKFKVNDSSGRVGKSCPGPVGSASAKQHKEDAALSTHSNAKGDRSESSSLRRSSRRATIERRVWALPRKMAKAPSPSVKEKQPFQTKASRKDQDRKVQHTVQSKPTSTSRGLPDTKRGAVMTEEMGTWRRKFKRKEGMRDVGDDVEEADESVAGEAEESAESSVSDVEDAIEEGASISVAEPERTTKNVMEEPSEVCVSSSSSNSGHNSGSDGECTDSLRTGLPLLAEAVVTSLKDTRTSKRDSGTSDKGLEEDMLDTGELCLTQAIVEEVVPDFGNDASNFDRSKGNARNTKLSEDQGLRGLEDVMEHSYSKLGQDCDVETVVNTEIHEPRSDPEVPFPSTTTRLTNSDSEEDVKECEALEVEANVMSEGEEDTEEVHPSEVEEGEKEKEEEEEEGKEEEEVVIEEGDHLTMAFTEEQLDNRLECASKCSSPEVTRDGDEHTSHSPEESLESQRDEADSHTIEAKNQDDERESVAITTNCVNQKSEGPDAKHTDASDNSGSWEAKEVNEEEEEEEEHVSLSVALAQLIDSGCGEVEGTETLTIHSLYPSMQAGSRGEQREVVEVDVSSKAVVAEKSEDEVDDDEDEEGELVIKEDEDEGTEEAAVIHSEDETLNAQAENDSKEERLQNGVSIMKTTNLPELCEEIVGGVAETGRRASSSPSPPFSPSAVPSKVKKQIPPLIKINSRPPAIRTPLKCPECPMQFCTVRSLLWHFGTHGAKSKENCLPPVLLKDLIVPWDKPSVSLFISQAADGEMSQVVPNSNEISLSASPLSPEAAGKGEAANMQDLVVTARILRGDDGLGSNGDVILKVPIPRLKPKPQCPATILKKDKYVNILPKTLNSDGQNDTTSQAQSSSGSPEVVTVKPQHSVPKVNMADNSAIQIQPLLSSSQPAIQIHPQSGVQIQPVASSQSGIQIQPMVSSSQSTLQIQPLVTGTSAAVHPVMSTTSTTKSSSVSSQIALIPVDNLGAVGQNIPSRSKAGPPMKMLSPPVQVQPASTPMDGILEKDGLVMINSNLALRIISSLPSSGDSTTNTTTSTTTIKPLTTQLTTANNLTILPQMEGSKLAKSKKEAMRNPDILTIVPQIDVSKKASLLKNVPSIPNTHSSSKSPAASQVLKLYLLQPKDAKAGDSGDNTVKLSNISEQFVGMNGLERLFPLTNGNEKTAVSENGNPREQGMDEDEEMDDLDDDDDEGMVIDDERDGEEDVMDPLSMCAVTMEDENLDASNTSGQVGQLTVDPMASSEDKVTIKKIVGKSKGKSSQSVDIVKYEKRKYVCCYCNRRFGWSTDLKRHVILHTGEKPFQCKVCPTAFTRKFLLQNHMKRMHPDKCKASDLWL